MNLILTRDIKTPTFTLGYLEGFGKKIGWTCEDVVRGNGNPATIATWKIPDVTAIPYGHYKVIIDFSDHFQKHLPHILDVPGFDGVRVHGGNSATDTSGCVLLGLSRTSNGVKNCESAVQDLMNLMTENGETWLDVVDA